MRGFIVEPPRRGPRHLSNIKTPLRDVTVFADCWLSRQHPQRSSTREWLLLPGQKPAPEPVGQSGGQRGNGSLEQSLQV